MTGRSRYRAMPVTTVADPAPVLEAAVQEEFELGRARVE
jgi:hypothetical protein